MRLNHVALTVGDRARSAAFYEAHFGLISRVHEDDHLLILGSESGALLALSQGESIAEQLPRTSHFGFQAATREEVCALRERFRADGVPETEWQDDPGGFTRVQVADPDGYRVEVFAY